MQEAEEKVRWRHSPDGRDAESEGEFLLLYSRFMRNGPWSAGLAMGMAGQLERISMYAYCLFCNTLRREELADVISQRLGIACIAPRILQRKWIQGRAYEAIHDYLPGYLFLYAERPIDDFAPLLRLENVYRVLGEADNGYCLTGGDLAFAQMLRGCGGTIGVLKIYRAGDKVRLAEGAMGGVAGEILRMDRRGRALVRFSFDGMAIQSWVAIEMIEGNVDAFPAATLEMPDEQSGKDNP